MVKVFLLKYSWWTVYVTDDSVIKGSEINVLLHMHLCATVCYQSQSHFTIIIFCPFKLLNLLMIEFIFITLIPHCMHYVILAQKFQQELYFELPNVKCKTLCMDLLYLHVFFLIDKQRLCIL